MLDKVLLKGDVLEALSRSPPATGDLRMLLEVAFPADVAELLNDLSPEQQLLLLRCLPAEGAAEVLSEAEERVQKDLLLNLLTRTEITGILDEIAPDEGADLMGLLPAEEAEEALEDLEPEQAEAIRSLSVYDPETAGGRMTTEFVTASADHLVGDTLATLRDSVDVESISNVYVVEEGQKLVGVLSVRDILEAAPDARVADVMTRELVTAFVDDDQETASRLLDRYDFTSLPVVDDAGRLLGVITVDDAMDVLEEEAEEDLALLAGSGHVTARDPVLRHLRVRLPWLLITLAGGLLAAFLLHIFEGTLKRYSTLILFMPVMAGMAGSVGIQSSTVMVRGFATGELELGMAAKTIARQVALGLLVGMICGSLTAVIAALLTDQEPLRMGMTIGVSMAAGSTTAAAMGTLLPILCQKYAIDPAVASGPFVTMLNDLLGILIYLIVAGLLLVHTA